MTKKNYCGEIARRHGLRGMQILKEPLTVEHWTDKALMVLSGVWLPKSVCAWSLNEETKTRTLVAVAPPFVRKHKARLYQLKFK